MNESTEFSPLAGSHRLADPARRVPRAVWPFIVLAAAQILLLTGPGILGGGGGYLDLRIVAILVIPTLLPVAVLIGRQAPEWRVDLRGRNLDETMLERIGEALTNPVAAPVQQQALPAAGGTRRRGRNRALART